MNVSGTIAEAPSGPIPIADSRFGTRDLKLSSALCALGFSLKLESQPLTVTIDGETRKRFVTFFHEDSTKLGNFSATDVDAWWRAPRGKYTIEGYDDALTAMKRVHQSRWEMLQIMKFGPAYRGARNSSIGTDSLHSASCLSACEIKCIGYEEKSHKWIFGKGSEAVLDQIEKGGRPESRPLSNDLCIDWMLECLRYRDWMVQLIRDPECVPVVEMRDGEKILMISKKMNEKDAAKWISYL